MGHYVVPYLLDDVEVSAQSGSSYEASGGLVLGGVATLTQDYEFTGSGGLLFGGDATESEDGAFEASGGFLLGGGTSPFTASGGVVIGGAADLSQDYEFTGSGGLLLGGEGSYSEENTFTSSGGFLFSAFPYAKRRKITVAAGTVSEDLINFPLMLQIPDLEDEPEVYFESQAGVMLPHERRYDSMFVVKTDIAAATDTIIYVFYEV